MSSASGHKLKTWESGWVQGETCFMGTASTSGLGQPPSQEAFET